MTDEQILILTRRNGVGVVEPEQHYILNALQAGRDALGEALLGVDEVLARRRPISDGWSILECVEHMVASESYLLGRLQCAQLSDHPPDNREREAKIAKRAANRARPIEAPKIVRPSARFVSLREAVTAFDATRAELIRWVQECSNDPRCLITDHPLFPGPVSCWETLLMIAAHPGRHAQQIVEIRRSFAQAHHQR